MIVEDTRPAPLVPPEVDLRGYPFTPVFRARLFGSFFHATANDSEWRAGVTLWLKSWDQVPAGTLPPDDVSLCRLAELGKDLRAWNRVKMVALHLWRECSDGRLHHPVVAEGVLEAWSGKKTASINGKAGADKRWGNKKGDANGGAKRDAIAPPSPSNSNRQGKGDREGNKTPPTPLTGGGGVPKNHTPPKKPESLYTEPFLAFWRTFPRKTDKLDAAKAYAKTQTKKPPVPPALILAGAERYAAERAADKRPGAERFTKHAATWLNGECWNDEVPSAPAANGHAKAAPTMAETMASDQRAKMQRFNATGEWHAMWGPKPGDPGCRIFPHILREFGREPV